MVGPGHTDRAPGGDGGNASVPKREGKFTCLRYASSTGAMNETPSSVSTEQASAVLVTATTVAAPMWFTTDLAGVSRIATAGLSWVVAAGAMAIGLRALA